MTGVGYCSKRRGGRCYKLRREIQRGQPARLGRSLLEEGRELFPEMLVTVTHAQAALHGPHGRALRRSQDQPGVGI